MTWHVVCRIEEEEDSFELTLREEDRCVEVWVDSLLKPEAVGSNVWRVLSRNALQPTQPAVDLYRMATAVFAADLRIPRISGFDRWTRDIMLHLPVSSVGLWENAEEPLRKLLSFLTGDHWRISLRKSGDSRPSTDSNLLDQGQPVESSAVCLLSGGLDSFIGAVDALAAGENLALVSHYAGGKATYSVPAQDAVRGKLAAEYGDDRSTHLKFRVDPPKLLTGEWEPTTRSRSIIFFGLGILVASALGEDTLLLVPENGLISLNVPLTYSRLGSLSTRTTHPHTMAVLREVISALGVNVRLDNPYLIKTKGEMLEDTAKEVLVRSSIKFTMSCAHPTAGRFAGGEGSGIRHCGYCVPCIIRRAALAKIGMDPLEEYRIDVTGSRPITKRQLEDLRAFLIAVEQARNGVGVRDLLRAGPLRPNPDELKQHLGVYFRGLDEVARLLTGRGVNH